MNVELDLTNDMLIAVRGTKVNSIENQHPNVIAARHKLASVNRKVQAIGWWFNTEFAFQLNPNTVQEIVIPSTTLKVKVLSPNYKHLVMRQGKLYDPHKHTYKITEPIIVDLTLQLPLEDLPVSAWSMIGAKATFEFFVDRDGDANLLQVYASAVSETNITLKKNQRSAENTKNESNPRVGSILSYHLGGHGGTNPKYPGGRIR